MIRGKIRNESEFGPIRGKPRPGARLNDNLTDLPRLPIAGRCPALIRRACPGAASGGGLSDTELRIEDGQRPQALASRDTRMRLRGRAPDASMNLAQSLLLTRVDALYPMQGVDVGMVHFHAAGGRQLQHQVRSVAERAVVIEGKGAGEAP